jgi:hypothetical protein
MSYLFFFSYARENLANDRNQNIRKFYRDLVNKVKTRSKQRTREASAFLDSEEIRNGEVWRKQITDALCTSRALVCATSIKYFQSSWCGKELTIFKGRIAQHQNAKGETPPSIQPILWDSLADAETHTAISGLQLANDQMMPAEYTAMGLSKIMEILPDSKQYWTIVNGIGDRIAEVIDSYELEELKSVPELCSVADAFSFQKQPEPDLRLTVGKMVQFIYAAGTRSEIELTPERSVAGIRYYDRNVLWQPFNPPADEEIGILAQRAANEEHLYVEQELPLDASLPSAIRAAIQRGKIVIAIVDQGSLHIERYRAALQPLDELNLRAFGLVLVLGSPVQPDPARLDRLKKLCLEVFQNNYARRSQIHFIDDVDTPQRCHAGLVAMLAELRNLLLTTAPTIRPPGGSPARF